MVRSTASFLVALALVATTAGCGSDSDTDTGTSPGPTVLNETFAGDNLNPNGARVHPFAVQAPGTVSATLTTLEPDTAVLIGLALGTWNGLACNVTIANDSASQGTVVVGTASSAGNLCVRIFDNGHLTQPANYVVTVAHF